MEVGGNVFIAVTSFIHIFVACAPTYDPVGVKRPWPIVVNTNVLSAHWARLDDLVDKAWCCIDFYTDRRPKLTYQLSLQRTDSRSTPDKSTSRVNTMPSWDGIEDASAEASRVWLVRVNDTDEWKPLRKIDCQALNAAPTTLVDIEGGRATADREASVVRYNFYRGAERQLCSAVWFRREEKSSKEVILHPIDDPADSALVEQLYQKAIGASSSLGAGISSVLKEEVVLGNDARVTILKVGGSLRIVYKEKGWFASSQLLQRGYGEYTIEGEDNEVFLGEVGHLCFAVHGIGEALFSKDDFYAGSASIVEQMNQTRIALHQKQVNEYKAACAAAEKKGLPLPERPKRIELIPIEWFQYLHDSSSSLMKSLRSVTLPSIPALRSLANDVVFDVLMYLTPHFCQAVLECVTEQISRYYAKFREIHPNFAGQCSLIGHSLGSVIVFDLLSVLKDRQRQGSTDSSLRGLTIAKQESTDVGYMAYAKQGDEHANTARHGTWGPSLLRRMEQVIPFVPACTIFLGSPLGLFLTLRGAHAVFDEMRLRAVEQARSDASAGKQSLEEHVDVPAASPFTLPTGSLYNIFHPSDPVAYRIEPLLLPQDIRPEDVPPPVYLTAPGKDVRLHVKARQIGEDLKKTLKDQKSAWNALLDTTLLALSTSAAAPAAESPDKRLPGQKLEPGPTSFPLGNPKLPMQARVDYSFQPGVVENEYINAILAHSSYFQHGDFQDFLVTRLSMVAEASAAEALLADSPHKLIESGNIKIHTD